VFFVWVWQTGESDVPSACGIGEFSPLGTQSLLLAQLLLGHLTLTWLYNIPSLIGFELSTPLF
jgi:hypothetical protein